jgi:hypothetical protein
MSTCNTKTRIARRPSQRLRVGSRTPPPWDTCSHAATWLRPMAAPVGPATPRGGFPCCHVSLAHGGFHWPYLPERRVLMLPRGSSCWAWLPERWVLVQPRGSGPWQILLALPPQEADSHVATWLQPRATLVGPFSLRGRLQCCRAALVSPARYL